MHALTIALVIVIVLLLLRMLQPFGSLNKTEHVSAGFESESFGSTKRYRNPRENYMAERIDCMTQPELCTDRKAYYDDYSSLPPYYGN